jgi:hypothetical protein
VVHEHQPSSQHEARASTNEVDGMKKPVKHPSLQTWLALNQALREAGENDCHQLLKLEQGGRKRKQFLKRIHSRLNKVRADRERAEFA